MSVDWATADGDAVAPADYQSASGTVFFPPGVLEQSFDVLVNGDVDIEPSESFTVRLAAPVDAQLGQQREGFGSIQNDDFPAAVAFVDDADETMVVAAEADSGTTECVFRVRLTGVPLTASSTVKYRTIAGSAAAGSDYVEVVDQTLTFTPVGSREQEIRIQVISDLLQESDEWFEVEMYDPVGVVLTEPFSSSPRSSVRFPCLIEDNDDPSEPRTIRVLGGAVLESAGAATFTLTLNKPRSGLTVDFATEDGTAVAGSDYVAKSGTAHFGEAASLTIAVTILNDILMETPSRSPCGFPTRASPGCSVSIAPRWRSRTTMGRPW